MSHKMQFATEKYYELFIGAYEKSCKEWKVERSAATVRAMMAQVMEQSVENLARKVHLLGIVTYKEVDSILTEMRNDCREDFEKVVLVVVERLGL